MRLGDTVKCRVRGLILLAELGFEGKMSVVVGITRYQLNVQRDKIPIPSVTCYHGKADCFRRLKSSTDVCEVIDSVSSLKTKTSQWQYTFFQSGRGRKKKDGTDGSQPQCTPCPF